MDSTNYRLQHAQPLTPAGSGVQYVSARAGFPIVAFLNGIPIAKITQDFGGYALWLADRELPFMANYKRTFSSVSDAKSFLEISLL